MLQRLAAVTVLACLSTAALAAGPKAWQDPMSGLAIGGFDPLAYFTEGEPRLGSEDFEFAWGGAVWRFANSGNRDAFKRDPQVYAPRFAGYDPYALANGRTAPGQPSIWARHGDAIYLFHNAANLQLWLDEREAMTTIAENKWPDLAAALPGSLGE